MQTALAPPSISLGCLQSKKSAVGLIFKPTNYLQPQLVQTSQNLPRSEPLARSEGTKTCCGGLCNEPKQFIRTLTGKQDSSIGPDGILPHSPRSGSWCGGAHVEKFDVGSSRVRGEQINARECRRGTKKCYLCAYMAMWSHPVALNGDATVSNHHHPPPGGAGRKT